MAIAANTSTTNAKGIMLHSILAHSYIIYFFALIVGVILNFYEPIQVRIPELHPLGYIFLLVGPALILWAQATARKTADARHAHREENTICRDHFCVGPYKIIRSPTNWGLFLLVLGFGLVIDSTTVVVMTLLAFVVSRLLFLTQQDMLLEERYGQAYIDYKMNIRR